MLDYNEWEIDVLGESRKRYICIYKKNYYPGSVRMLGSRRILVKMGQDFLFYFG
jgi:hypothetical protein